MSEEELTDEEINDFFNYLLETGCIELVGVNFNGEVTYKFTTVCKEMFPELYQAVADEHGQNIMDLWTNDFISMVWQDNDQMVYLTDKAFNVLEVLKLPEEQQNLLVEMIGMAHESVERSEERQRALQDDDPAGNF